MRLSPITIRDTALTVKRYLKLSNWVVSSEALKAYLKTYLKKAPWTYNSEIVRLRRFFRDYLERPEMIGRYKTAPLNALGSSGPLPDMHQIRAGFDAQVSDLDRALYLFAATTGLRRGEILGLRRDQIDLETGAVMPNHVTRTKLSGITFFNAEARELLKRYLSRRTDSDPRLFPISERQRNKIWRRATEAAGIKIGPQILRVWFSSEMGERGIPDRYVDIFQGRAPRSVIAKCYTRREIEKLRGIYERAGLNVLRE
jgi:integrase